jgi:hypothetical protein
MEYVYIVYGSNGLPDWDMDAGTWMISVHRTKEGAELAVLDRQTSPNTPVWEHAWKIEQEKLQD